MLERLYIKNVALIRELELNFSSGLNILSGETGAGKSIIIDCIMLLMGNRFDSSLLRYGSFDGMVEGVFSSVSEKLLDEYGLERDECVIITRRFNSEGRNDIRINGRSFTLNMLRRFSSVLIDIYGQNESQRLFDPEAQLELLDNYAGQEVDYYKHLIAEILKRYKDVKKSIANLGDDAERERNIDLLKFQISEIENAAVKEDEENELMERRKLLLSSEKISQTLQSAASLLRNDSINSAVRQLSQIAALSDSYSEIRERLESLSVELDDIRETIDMEQDNAVFEEGELETLEERLRKVREIKRKYGDYDHMLSYLQSAKERLDFLASGADNYIKFTKQLNEIGRELFDCANKISEIRKSRAKSFEKAIVAQLATLGMPGSAFEIKFTSVPETVDMINENGYDKIEFYLSTNPGYPLRPFVKVASGGESSRFMLAIKAITGAAEAVSTMIFDEIDAGISGKTGQVVACKLADIAKSHQVLCITHLASIAAMADCHFFINKEISEGNTFTYVDRLTEDQSIVEISRLLGAKDISDQSELSAKQLREWGINYKNYHENKG